MLPRSAKPQLNQVGLTQPYFQNIHPNHFNIPHGRICCFWYRCDMLEKIEHILFRIFILRCGHSDHLSEEHIRIDINYRL